MISQTHFKSRSKSRSSRPTLARDQQSLTLLPTELFLAISSYLFLQDIKSLSQTSLLLRHGFRTLTWSHVTVFPNEYIIKNQTSDKYRYSETRPITAHMLLFPENYKSWFIPEFVEHIVILWSSLTDICSVKDDYISKHLGSFLTKKFPNLQQACLKDRLYDVLEPHKLDPISSLGTGFTIPGVETVDSMIAFGDLGWPEIFSIFQSSPKSLYTLSSVLCLYALSNYDNVCSLSLIVTTVMQSECLHLSITDLRFLQCIKRLKNLETFELREDVPDVTDSLQIDGLIDALNSLPKLKKVAIKQYRFNSLTMRKMNQLKGNYECCELVVNTPTVEVAGFPTQKVELKTITHIDFDNNDTIARHQNQHHEEEDEEETEGSDDDETTDEERRSATLIDKLSLPNVRSIKGLVVSFENLPTTKRFDKVLDLDICFIKSREITSTGLEFLLRFPNLRRLRYGTDFDLHRRYGSLEFHSEVYALYTIFKILSEMFMESVGTDYLEYLEIYHTYTNEKINSESAGLESRRKVDKKQCRNQIRFKFLEILRSENVSGDFGIKENKTFTLFAELFGLSVMEPTKVVNFRFSVWKYICQRVEQSLENLDKFPFSQKDDSTEQKNPTENRTDAEINSLSRTNSNCSEGGEKGTYDDGSVSFSLKLLERQKRLEKHLQFLARPSRPMFLRNLEFVCVSLALAGLKQDMILRTCPHLEYLEMEQDEIGLFHPYMGHLLQHHKTLKQMLFPTISVNTLKRTGLRREGAGKTSKSDSVSKVVETKKPTSKKRRREDEKVERHLLTADVCTEIMTANRFEDKRFSAYGVSCVVDVDKFRAGYTYPTTQGHSIHHNNYTKLQQKREMNNEDFKTEASPGLTFDVSRRAKGNIVWPYELYMVPEPEPFAQDTQESTNDNFDYETIAELGVFLEKNSYLKYESTKSWISDEVFKGWI